MGFLIYAGVDYEIEDRTLAHLKAAVGHRLRMQESFFISWLVPVEKGSGRISLWVSPSVPIVFRFAGSRAPELNPVWLEALRTLSHTSRGMLVLTEAEAEAYMKDKTGRETP